MEAYILDGIRTPIGRAHPEKGWLKDIRSDEMGVIVIKELLKRTNIDPRDIDDVIIGCATQTGEQAMNVARYIAVMAGLPFSIPAQTINRQCASGMSAVHIGAMAIISGYADIVIAGGIESMTHLPEGSGADLNPKRFDFIDPSSSSMGLTAENLAKLYGISRREQEEFALKSHRKAVRAQEGAFLEELVPVKVGERVIDRDQNPRPYTDLDIMSVLPPITTPEGTITSATSCFAGDGACALILISGRKAEKLGLKPLAKIEDMSWVGVDPKLMGLGALEAARKILKKRGLKPDDIDLWEINESFAVVPIVVMRELGIPEERVNPNGGALALGHPMGATGARLVLTLAKEMRRRGSRYGIATMCVGMGQGTATLLRT